MEATRKYRRRRSLLRDTEGAAYVEAVIVIPVFLTIWAGAYFFSNIMETAIESMHSTRQAGWAHVMSNCEGGGGGSAPEGVDLGVAGTSSHTDPSIADATAPALGFIAQFLGMLDTIVGLVPIFGDLYPGLVNDEIQASASATVTAPDYLGGYESEFGSNITLMCNEEPSDVTFWDYYLWPPLGFFN